MNTRTDARFLLKWVLATTLGVVIGAWVGCVVAGIAFPAANPRFLSTSPLFFWLSFGLIVGLAQWVLLRSRIRHSYTWILATALGFFLAAVAIKLLNRPEPIRSLLTTYELLPPVIGGMVVGFAQYRFLRHRMVHAVWWTLVFGVGWAIMNTSPEQEMYLLLLAHMLIFATVTGYFIETWTRTPLADGHAGRSEQAATS